MSRYIWGFVCAFFAWQTAKIACYYLSGMPNIFFVKGIRAANPKKEKYFNEGKALEYFKHSLGYFSFLFPLEMIGQDQFWQHVNIQRLFCRAVVEKQFMPDKWKEAILDFLFSCCLKKLDIKAAKAMIRDMETVNSSISKNWQKLLDAHRQTGQDCIADLYGYLHKEVT